MLFNEKDLELEKDSCCQENNDKENCCDEEMEEATFEDVKAMLRSTFLIYLHSQEVEMNEKIEEAEMMDLFEMCKKQDPDFTEAEEDMLLLNEFLKDPEAASEDEAEEAEESLGFVLDLLETKIGDDASWCEDEECEDEACEHEDVESEA